MSRTKGDYCTAAEAFFFSHAMSLNIYFLSAIKEKPKSIDIQDPKINNVCENAVNQNVQVSLPGKEEKIKALNQQVTPSNTSSSRCVETNNTERNIPN